MSSYKEFDFADQLFYSPPTPSNNLGQSGKCMRLPASPIYISQSNTIATQTANNFPRHHSSKISKRRKTRIKNLKDFLDNDYNETSDEKKKKRRLLRKKLNCYRNLRIYKTKHKVGKKATNQQIFKKNLLPYLCTINLQYKLLCSEVQNIKRLCRAIYNTQFKV